MMSTDSREGVEEERRLFYVALTRAEKRAILTYASQRYRWGKLTDGELSRFVDEIDDRYIDMGVDSSTASRVSHILDASIFEKDSHIVARGGAADAYTSPFTSRGNTIPVRKKSASSTIDPSKLRRVSEVSGTRDSSSAMLDLQVGQRVRHERFGVGEVLSLEGSGGDARAIIRFEDVGEKKMLLKFAKIQKI
jgi:DNA helicase-2/ATP-dependent DNA helicase PcrA